MSIISILAQLLHFLELIVIALCFSSVACWTLSDPGRSSSGVKYFCLFILSTGFSQQEYWSRLPFPPPLDHVLSEVSTVTCPSWVAPHMMNHGFIGLCKPLLLDKAVIHERCPTVALKNIGMCHFLLQGIFPTQWLKPCLLVDRQILLHWATRETLYYWGFCLLLTRYIQDYVFIFIWVIILKGLPHQCYISSVVMVQSS